MAARSSCFAFKGKREDLRTIGERLDVATVLEGTVRRSGSRLRITAQLVNAADGYQMWSERYDREMTDVFELQDEIANAIALRLRGALADEDEKSKARSGTKNIEAYEMFLRGRALQHKRGRFMHEAVQCLERAIELDPGFAEPKAWLADSYRLMSTFGSSPYSEVMPLAKRLAREALAIDDSIADAWAFLRVCSSSTTGATNCPIATGNEHLGLSRGMHGPERSVRCGDMRAATGVRTRH